MLRKQGNIGTVTVKWLLTGNPGTDVERSEGTVTFTSGAVEALLYVNVRGDPIPELDKTYQLILSDAAPVRNKKDKYLVWYVCVIVGSMTGKVDGMCIPFRYMYQGTIEQYSIPKMDWQ